MKNKGIIVLVAITVIIVIFTIVVGIKISSKEEFLKPKFDINSKPISNSKIEEKLQYAEINVEEGYIVGICNNLVLDKENKVLMYFSSLNNNSVYLKLRIYDKKGNILEETGLIKPGYQIEKIRMDNLKEDKDVIIKIMSYDPETYYSKGTISLNTRIKIGDI